MSPLTMKKLALYHCFLKRNKEQMKKHQQYFAKFLKPKCNWIVFCFIKTKESHFQKKSILTYLEIQSSDCKYTNSTAHCKNWLTSESLCIPKFGWHQIVQVAKYLLQSSITYLLPYLTTRVLDFGLPHHFLYFIKASSTWEDQTEK